MSSVQQQQQQQNDIEFFHLIHGTISEETNIVVAVCKYILNRRKNFENEKKFDNNKDNNNDNNDNNDEDDDDDERSLSVQHCDQVRDYCWNTRESRIVELKRALCVLEACFLLSSKCSTTVASIHGFKLLLNILSDGIMYINDERYLHFKCSNGSGSGSSGSGIGVMKNGERGEKNEQRHVEEIQLLVLDVLEASLHNSFSNVVLFCAESGPDVIVTVLWNSACALTVRVKCVEFLLLLIKWAQATDEQAGIIGGGGPSLSQSANACDATGTTSSGSSLDCGLSSVGTGAGTGTGSSGAGSGGIEESTVSSVMNRIQTFLGAKLTSDFRDLYQKFNTTKKESGAPLVDQQAIEQFIKRMDQKA